MPEFTDEQLERDYAPERWTKGNVVPSLAAALLAERKERAKLDGLLREWYARWDAYRMMHDTHGAGSPQAGRAWDQVTQTSNRTMASALAALAPTTNRQGAP